MTETEVQNQRETFTGAPLMATRMEEGAPGQRMQVSLETRKGKEVDSPWSLERERSPANTWFWSQKPIPDADLQNHRRVDLCWLKPLSVCSFVTAAMGT